MTCVFTGAVPYLEDHGCFLDGADIYKIDSVVIIRWVGKGFRYEPKDETVTHLIRVGPSNNFIRQDIGVLVVPASCVIGDLR